jgi:hypothetical protein
MVENQYALGYYKVGQQIYTSKIAACIKATEVKQNVKWFFKDEEFDGYDWTKEPSDTLAVLYERRARAIRERYDYVVLSYSGGSDSHNILETFLKHGLFIDEVLVNTFEKANKKIVNDPSHTNAENYGAEYRLQIYPRLEELRLKSPATKITIADQSDFMMNELLAPSASPEWVVKQREVLNPSGMSRYNYLHQKEVRLRVDKSKSVCVMLGVEKPITFFDTSNRYYVLFVDSATNLASVDPHFHEYDNTSVEYFYWGDGCADLIAKQCFVIKHWLEANPHYKPLWLFKSGHQYKQHLALRHALLRNVLYDNWNSQWFQVTKGRLDWFDSIDAWFYASNYEAQRQTWERGIQYVRDKAHAFIEGNGLMPFGKKFYIGDMK